MFDYYLYLFLLIYFLTAPVGERSTLSSLISKKGLNGALYVAGEVLFITRPLIYVLFIRKYGARSWIPWFLSLAVDFTGMGILSRITSSTGGTEEQQFHLSVPEKNEVRYPQILYRLRDQPSTKCHDLLSFNLFPLKLVLSSSLYYGTDSG